MALIPYPDADSIDAEAQAAIDSFAKDHGRPTLLRQILAWSPPALEAMEDLYHPIFLGGVLSREFKEMLFVAASQARECPYCAGGHSRLLVQEFGYDEADVRVMREGDSNNAWSEKDRLLVAYVRKIAVDPAGTVGADLESLREVGWTDEELTESTAMAAHAAWTTAVAQTFHLEHDLDGPDFDGYF
ncbi:carboxymuconolactone decarboxylase family protein [Candidatus Poriferisodalis sp.]|uniref:carboxymuconolactone decarboxylase family protein n=1 Tax=Candidatus Poriferisodalis sp. TaxID=3101277 RepID=UPI003B51D5AC